MTDADSSPALAMNTGRDTLRYYTRKLQRHPALEAMKRPLRAARSAVPSLWRMATQEFRQLPSVVIVGAQKAGTTQLYAHLIKHPRLFGACEKEVNYFSMHAQRSLHWYQSRFPLKRRVAAARGKTLEASPSYLPIPAALRRMHAALPGAQIIAVLRDPVSRAFSHYQHAKTRGHEPRSFHQAVEEELRQNRFPARPGAALPPDAPPMWHYVARGYYALQLELLLDLFPPERVLVIDSADLFADTNAACQVVFNFLGLEPFDVQPGKVYNRGYYKEQIDAQMADRLREHYQPYDALLVDLLGQSFRWMSNRTPLAA